MKSVYCSVLALVSLVAGCSAPTSDEAVSSEEALTTDPSTQVFSGSFERDGARYQVEVSLNLNAATYVRTCSSSGAAFYSISGDGTARTTVRAASGAIWQSTEQAIPSSSTGGFESSAKCAQGKIADTSAPASVFLTSNVRVPGVLVQSASGPIWVAPNYGGPISASTPIVASARFVASTAGSRSTQANGGGEDLKFKGSITYPAGSSLKLQVGFDIQDRLFPRQTQTITLTK